MSDIKEGDNVSWNWGNGHPEGTVAEVKTSGELAIDTAGKHIKVNASEENPAVHVAREGNDVVKRASALTKLDDGGDNAQESTDNDTKPETNGTSNGENQTITDDEVTKENVAAAQETEATTSTDNADKMDISTVSTPGEEKVGEKRARDDDDIGDAPSPEEKDSSDDATGKEVKKAKLVEEDVEKSAPDSSAEETTTAEDTPAADETTPKKKAGRPRKADSTAKESSASAEGDGKESIARRTRSKA